MNKVVTLHDGLQLDQVARASLRRIDWRFLLPTPPCGGYRRLLLGGGSSALPERLLETKWAQEITTDLSADCRVDAVVLLHDSPISRQEAVNVLKKGGSFYQEIKRKALDSIATRPSALRRQLREAGLTLTGVYWAAPDFDQCRRYIPLDAEGAVQWYFSSHFVAGTPSFQLIRTLVDMLVGKESERFGWFVPTLAITGMASASAAQPSLLGDVNLRELLPADELRPMLLTSGQDDASRLIMLPFASRNGDRPQAVIKIASTPSFNGETELEQEVLQELHRTLEPSLSVSVPRALGRFTYEGHAVSIESCARGQSMWASSGAWRGSPQGKISDLEVGRRWLTAFHQQTEVRRLFWDRQAIAQWIDAPLNEYRTRRGSSSAEDKLFGLMHDHAKALIGAEFPLVWQHNDFAPWNLFRSGEGLTVIDWEFNRSLHSIQAGPVLCDLYYFVTYWHHVANHLYTDQAELAGMKALFLGEPGDSHYVRAARKAIAEYVAAMQVDWRFAPLFLVSTWVERVVYSYARAEKMGGQSAKPRATEKFAGYVSLLADHADDLFCLEKRGFWQDAYFAQAIEDLG